MIINLSTFKASTFTDIRTVNKILQHRFYRNMILDMTAKQHYITDFIIPLFSEVYNGNMYDWINV